LSTLNEREATPTELATLLDASVGTVAYHVRTLHGLGLIELTGETRVRGAVAHHYRAVPEGAGESEQNGPGSAGASVVALDPEVCRVAAVGNFEDEGAISKRAALRLDTTGWRELSQACTRLLEQADRLARASAERLAKNPHESERSAGLVMFMFESGGESGEGSGASEENGNQVF